MNAADLLGASAFATGPAGFVGVRIGLGPAAGPAAGRHRLRHGHLTVAGGRAVVSVPPSPGLEVCARRAADDLAAARDLLPGPAGAHGVRVCLDAGADAPGPGGYRRRWAVAHAIGPVLVAAFAGSPGGGWRSSRLGPRLAAPGAVPAGGDPRSAWAAHVLDADGGALRSRLRHPGGISPERLARHAAGVWAPVAARGHLDLDLADGPDWLVPLAVTAVLVDDPRAAEAALAATHRLRRDAWPRAARHGLTDPDIAAAARGCFLAAYAALARHGAARDVRDAVAVHTERYVLRGRSPADDRQASSVRRSCAPSARVAS